MKKILYLEAGAKVALSPEFPAGPLYNADGYRVGEIISVLNIGDLAGTGSISLSSLEIAVRALLEQNRKINAIKLLRQYAGEDKNGYSALGLS